MEKKKTVPDPQSEDQKKPSETKPENERDLDDEVHKTSPDLITKEDHHLPIDDEVKNG